MADTYQKALDESGNVIGQVVKQVTESVNLVDLDQRIVAIEQILLELKQARDTFQDIPDPIIE